MDERDLGLTQDLIEHLAAVDTNGLLAFRAVDERLIDGAPRSLIDVSRLAEELDLRFVLYGIVRKTNAFYDAQLRIFDNVIKDDAAVFYVKAGVDSYERVPRGLAEQAAHFTRTFLGITEEQQAARQRFGGLSVRSGGGYWVPYGRWADRTRGIATGALGLRMIPTTPLIWRQTWEFTLRLGLETVYQVGEEVPGLIPSRVTTFSIDLPVDACWQIQGVHSFCAGLAPSLRIDTATLQPLFEEQQTSRTNAAGVVARVGYEYWMGRSRRVGLGTELSSSVYVYDPALFSAAARAYVAVRLGPWSVNQGEDSDE